MGLVREGGLEPPHHCWRQDLNLVRLPISPPAQSKGDIVSVQKSSTVFWSGACAERLLRPSISKEQIWFLPLFFAW